MKRSQFVLIAATALVGLLTVLAGPEHDHGPATSTSPATATASAPTERFVRWHGQYKPAAAEATKNKTLLLVVYYDADAPAWQAFDSQTLARRATRTFLADFAAARVNVKSDAGKKLFKATGAKETPLTQVLTPAGKLLDSIPGCIIPASLLIGRLSASQEYWSAATAPATPATRWRAVRARLKLSTRHEAAGEIDKLLKLPPAKLPKGVSKAKLTLAKGVALVKTKPTQAAKLLAQAYKLAPDDADVGGEALLQQAAIAEKTKEYQQAYELCIKYIKAFPSGKGVWRAYKAKAVLEYLPLDDQAGARDTLEKFMEEYPDHPQVAKARRMLEAIKPPEVKDDDEKKNGK